MTINQAIAIRPATADDISGISHVRFSVRENQSTPEALAALGITPESVAASLSDECRGWVAEDDARIVAFSIADREKSTIFALFVLPEYQGRGLGTELLARAVNWLWDHEADVIWLTTGSGTRAARFYERAGWTRTGADAGGELRFEVRRS
jgi:GNAT superfamily N-acetyltransferase